MQRPELTPQRLRELKRLAVAHRRLVVDTVHHAGAGHPGGSLSATEILVSLYFEVLNIDPAKPRNPDRDRFIMSKGHASVGLYAAMALRGYLPLEEMRTFDAIDSRLQGHPDMSTLPGLDMSSGSLGQGLSPGIGMALAARLQGRSYHTWVLLGDGDSQEGQVWEAAFVAARYQLSNLTAIVDWNGLQQYGWATPAGYGSGDRLAPQPNPVACWQAFGWRTLETDGHDFEQLLGACQQTCDGDGRPTVILARTCKGRGISFMEGDYAWHAKPVTDDDLARARAELEQQESRI